MGRGQHAVRVDEGAAAEKGAASLSYGQYRHKGILAIWNRLAAHYLGLDLPWTGLLGPDRRVLLRQGQKGNQRGTERRQHHQP